MRARVTKDWKEKARADAAREIANKLASEIRGGKDPAEVAKAGEFRVRKTKLLTRGDAVASAANREYFMYQMFRGKQGEVVVGRTPRGWAVLRIDEIKAPDDKEKAKAVKALNEGFTRSWQASVLIAYDAGLKTRFKIDVDQESIDALFDRQQ